MSSAHARICALEGEVSLTAPSLYLEMHLALTQLLLTSTWASP